MAGTERGDEPESAWRVVLPFRADGGYDFTHGHDGEWVVAAVQADGEGKRVATCPRCSAELPIGDP